MVQQLETDLKKTLPQQNSLEQWATWLKCVITHVPKPYEEKPYFTTSARRSYSNGHFTAQWSSWTQPSEVQQVLAPIT
jgi:regulatory factor X 1/2/3